MTLLWITVFLLHQGYAMVPVVTVQLGEAATFTCDVMNKFQTTTWLQWYKQSAGDTMKLITMQRKNVKPSFGPEFTSRFSTTNDGKTSNLTILRTVQQDEGMYYCALIDWTESIWRGTHLMVKGTSNSLTYTILDSETLQCSVVLEYWNHFCLRDLSVFCKSQPNIIYTQGKINNCEKSPNAGNISLSDLENYDCAAATCGEILFRNEIRKEEGQSYTNWILFIIICLGISVIVNIILICNQIFARKIFKVCAEKPSGEQKDETPDEGQDMNYSTLHFSGGKTSRGTKKKESKTEEIVYSQVKRSV